ncbi:MAG: hypothetical protein AB7G24_06985 [Novosphingobium sp.]
MSEDREIYEGAEGFREWAQAQISQQHQMFGSMLEQHSALYRWILAARLSVNGGAAIAVLNTANIDPAVALIALSLFVIGILLAIVAAELDQKALQASFRFNADAVGFWSKAAVTGKFDATRLAEIGKQAGFDAAKSKPGKIVGLASILVFVAGVAVIGISMAKYLPFCQTPAASQIDD